jgi:hypothetical protein
MWLSSIEIGIIRQLESAHAADDMSSLTGIHLTLTDVKDGGSQLIGVIDSLLGRSDVLHIIPSLDADLHQSFWDVILRVGHHAASAVKSAILRDIQYVLIVEGGMSDSDADACIAACVLSISPAQFLNELDASREGIGGSYAANTSWGRVVSSLCYPIHFLTPAILHRAGIAHSIARRVHDFATYELDKSDDPMIALLPHASLISLSQRFLGIFDQAFHMASNILTIYSLQLIEHTLAQEDIQIQVVVDEICRTCQDMLDCFHHAMLSDASSSACSLIFLAVCKACVMAALQMKLGDIDGISFLDAIQVKLMVSLKVFMCECNLDNQLESEKRYNYTIYVDLFKCLTRRGIEGDVGVLLMPTQDLIFEYTKMRNGKVGKSELGIRDLQAVLVRRSKSGDIKASEFLQSNVEEPSNWRLKFDVLDSEASFMVASCRMRHVNAQRRKQGGIFSNDSWFRGSFILTKFHCAFVQDDAEDNSSSICFILAQLSQVVLNHRKSTISLNGLPKSRKNMFYIRIHIIEVVGITEEVAIQLSLCGESWSSAPLCLAKSRRKGALDSGSRWLESRLICKDLSESMYPSKCQLAESPPLAVDTVPSSLVVQLSSGSHVLGQGMLSVGEVSPLVVNDFVIKVKLATGSIADIRVFVTVVPASSGQQPAQQDVRIELGGFDRIKEIAERFASHLTGIGLEDSVSVNVVENVASDADFPRHSHVSVTKTTALGVDLSSLLRLEEQPLGKFSCTWLGQGGVFNKETPGTLVITDMSIYFFNRDLSKVLDLSIHMIEDDGLKSVRHRLTDTAIAMPLVGEAGITYATAAILCHFACFHVICNFTQAPFL